MLASPWPTSMPLLFRPSWQAARAAALEALRQHPDTHLVQAAVAKAPSGEGWWWKCRAQGCHRAGALQGGPLNLAWPSPLSSEASNTAGPIDCMLPLFISAVGHVLNEVFEGLVESSLQQPTFVLDHPLEISPLVSAGLLSDGRLLNDARQPFVCCQRARQRAACLQLSSPPACPWPQPRRPSRTAAGPAWWSALSCSWRGGSWPTASGALQLSLSWVVVPSSRALHRCCVALLSTHASWRGRSTRTAATLPRRMLNIADLHTPPCCPAVS